MLSLQQAVKAGANGIESGKLSIVLSFDASMKIAYHEKYLKVEFFPSSRYPHDKRWRNGHAA